MNRWTRAALFSVAALSAGLDSYRAGQTGLLRLTWDNGDRTVLVNPELGGITLGWNLTHSAQDELFAAIEGTAFHTRVVLERLQPEIDGGRFPVKRTVGDTLTVTVDLFADSHDVLAGVLASAG